jgi:predicted nucleic acid-binding protein
VIVVDTNLIGYLYLESKDSQLAEQALLKDPDWAAPLLWRSEFGNVLALYMRRRGLTLEDVQQTMTEGLGLMEGREYEVDSRAVLSLVGASNCSAYDCEFVALAQELGAPLVTVDKQIISEFPEVAVALADFAGSQARKPGAASG